MIRATCTLLLVRLLLGACDGKASFSTASFVSPSKGNIKPRTQASERRQQQHIIGDPTPLLCISLNSRQVTGQTALTYNRKTVALAAASQTPSPHDDDDSSQPPSEERRRKRIRTRIAELARNVMIKPLASAAPMPAAIAALLKDATINAVDMAVDEVTSRRFSSASAITNDISDLVNDAFAPMEASLLEMDRALEKAKISLKEAKIQATHAIEAVQAAAIAQAKEAASAVAAAEKVAEQKVIANMYSDVDVENLRFEDVQYDESDMAPPFLDEFQCLVPGEPIVRVEKAPENSRRIFAGIDILASVDEVWKVSFFQSKEICHFFICKDS
jgi:hypothetical protein